MNKFSGTLKWFLCASVIFLFTQCNTPDKGASDKNTLAHEDSCGITVEAEDFIDSKSDFSKNNSSYIKATKGGWLAYEINIPAAGRYSITLFAQASDSSKINCWVEDYADNTNGRSYNITGNMILQTGTDTASFNQVKITGSPLNAGIHKMRVHYDSGAVMMDKICFSLIKPHHNSPLVLKQKTDGKEWVLAWSDEFNGTGLPDTSKWVYDIGNWGWGNNELQYYTAGRVENARQEDGNLIIEARKNDNGYQWTSARLTTRGKESFLYGKIEFRAKVPVGRGSWAAGWLLGDSYVDEYSWPNCGEVDVLESVGYQNDSLTNTGKAHASIHCGAYYFKLNNQPTKIASVKNMDTEFHNYTMEWSPKGIKMLIDGKYYFDYHDNRTSLSWPFDKPQNLILNLAMGGGMGGVKGVDPLLTSQQLIFDYVRVYELN